MIREKWRAFKEDIQGRNAWYAIRKIFVHYIYFFKTYDRKKTKAYRRMLYQKAAFAILTKFPGWKGTTDKQYDRELIVSLTSYPARIDSALHATRSLLLQNLKPNRLILWLAESQFPNKEKDLPKELTDQCRYGLEIRWTSDVRSYKKLIPALMEFPEAIIVTTDDDVHYRSTMIRRLYKSYQQQPNCIWAHNIKMFFVSNGELIGRAKTDSPTKMQDWNRNWIDVPSILPYARTPMFINEAVGCGGVLYPPHCLHPDVLNEELFTSMCGSNDDIWFWTMAVLAGTKSAAPKRNQSVVDYVEGTQEQADALYRYNEWKGYFAKDLEKVLNYYPQMKETLISEFDRVIGTKLFR